MEDSPGFEGSPTIALKYPTVTVYGSPSSWLSQSQLVSMASNPDDISGDDTSSSLGDSTYEFIDDKSTMLSRKAIMASSAETLQVSREVSHLMPSPPIFAST